MTTPPPPPAPPEPAWLRPRMLAGAGLAAAGALGLCLLLIAPLSAGAPYPPCPFRLATGWHCPGCGSARALHALVEGRPAAAAGHNLLLVLFAVPLFPWLAWQAWCGLVHDRFATLRLPRRSAWVILVIVVLFAVARNLPGAERLAP